MFRSLTQIFGGMNERSHTKFQDNWMSLNKQRVFACLATGLQPEIRYNILLTLFPAVLSNIICGHYIPLYLPHQVNLAYRHETQSIYSIHSLESQTFVFMRECHSHITAATYQELTSEVSVQETLRI